MWELIVQRRVLKMMMYVVGLGKRVGEREIKKAREAKKEKMLYIRVIPERVSPVCLD